MQKLRPVTTSRFTSIEELPFAMTVKDVAKALGLSTSKTYQLMNTTEFPRLNIGKRLIVPKAKFIEWMDKNTL